MGGGILGFAVLGVIGFLAYRKGKAAGAKGLDSAIDDVEDEPGGGRRVSEMPTSANVSELDSRPATFAVSSTGEGKLYEVEHPGIAELPSPVPDSYRR